MQAKYRLKARASFTYIYNKGQSFSNPLFRLVFVKAGSPKIGISVGKKVGNAVCRNRVKRRINAAFREYMPKLNGRYNYIVLARSEIANAPYSEILKQAERSLNKLGHLK
ncbi:MAG: ribonuclease P protein component [Christensenellaceae bacterium]|nr:ribonuclease P protein component [Christensenellaceae bacterium]